MRVSLTSAGVALLFAALAGCSEPPALARAAILTTDTGRTTAARSAGATAPHAAGPALADGAGAGRRERPGAGRSGALGAGGAGEAGARSPSPSDSVERGPSGAETCPACRDGVRWFGDDLAHLDVPAAGDRVLAAATAAVVRKAEGRAAAAPPRGTPAEPSTRGRPATAGAAAPDRAGHGSAAVAAGGPQGPGDEPAGGTGVGSETRAPAGPRNGGRPAAALTAPLAAPLDLRTATHEELEALPAIGPARARAIVALRMKGELRTLADLRRLRGFGPATLGALRGRVLVSPAPAPAPTEAGPGAGPPPRAADAPPPAAAP